MNVLFDQGVPVPLREYLLRHTVSTAYELGWSQLSNGDLLDAATAQFDAFVTTDQDLRCQQDLTKCRIAILVLPTTSWPRIQANLPRVVAAVDDLNPGDFRELAFST